MSAKPDINAMLEEVDLEEWCDYEGVEFRMTTGSRGTQVNVRECPVCGNDSWKVYLNAESGLGNCFSGDHPPEKKFNKFRFAQYYLGLSPKMTFEYLTNYLKRRGYRPPPPKTIPKPKVLPTDFSLPYHLAISKLIPYLEVRGISAETSIHFDLGYCPDVPEASYRFGIEGDWKFQSYAKRILVPIRDLNGKLASFQGRDTTGTSDRKYIFPPGLAATSSVIYNGDRFKPGVKRVILGEGVFDCFAIHQAISNRQGFSDAIACASFGKNLSFGTEDHQLAKFESLKQLGLEEVIFVWDGTLDATDDAIKACTLLRGVGIATRVALLPTGKDPNEVSESTLISAIYNSHIAISKSDQIKIMMAQR